MSLIDQRILIIAPAEAIWTYIADPAMLSKWHQGCKQVSVLSTRSTGVGARRRVVGSEGRAIVEETTASLENMGYEYVVIDGPYRSFKARFRLQAIPEGTMLNWTIEYRLKGALSGLRNLLTHQRKLEDQMISSLKQLKKTVEGSGAKIDLEKHARSAMQDRPTARDRAARHPELTQVSGQAAVPTGTPPYPTSPIIVDEDDIPQPVLPAQNAGLTVPSQPVVPVPSVPTEPPRPAVAAEKTITAPSVTARESSPRPPIITDSEEDTKPRPPAGLREAIAASTPATPAEAIEAVSDSEALTVPISLVAPPRPPDPDTQTIEVPAVLLPDAQDVPGIPSALPERVPTDPLLLIKPSDKEKTPPKGISIVEPEISALDDTHPTSPVVVPPEVAGTTGSKPSLPEQTDKLDTGETSIWEVFGEQRPSERTKAALKAAVASFTPPALPAVEIAPQAASSRASTRRARPPVRPISRKTPRLKSRQKIARRRW